MTISDRLRRIAKDIFAALIAICGLAVAVVVIQAAKVFAW